MLTGQNGILTQAQKSREQTDIGREKEQIALAYNGVKTKKEGGDVTSGELDAELKANGANATATGTNPITVTFNDSKRSYTIDANGNIKEEGSGTVTQPTGTTFGSIYTDDMIGQKVTYSSNGQSDWIIFGKDKDGNILITTAKPIDNGFDLYGSAEKWLSYEDDLNVACSGYGAKIKETTVTSRSITMEDINYVSGFDVSKLKFDTYTFGTELDYANKKVDFYYPSLDAASTGYWKKATGEADSKTFENNYYDYGYSENNLIYQYAGGQGDASSLVNKDRLNYVIGGNSEETAFNPYLIASRSVNVNKDFNSVMFLFAAAGNRMVISGAGYLCGSGSDFDSYEETGEIGSFGIRPIVVLPAGIEVEKNENGLWDIAY